MQSLRHIKNRIRSIENTRKVTSALEMISVAKLNKLDDMLQSFELYAQTMESMLDALKTNPSVVSNAFVQIRQQVESKTGICVVSSDSGLCGSFNQTMMAFCREQIKRIGASNVVAVCIGKRAAQWFKDQNIEVVKGFFDFHGRFSEQLVEDVVHVLSSLYLENKVHSVRLFYTHFENALVFKPLSSIFLPLSFKETTKGVHVLDEYVLEPDASLFADELIEHALRVRIKYILLDSFTSEHAARALAMRSAHDNAKELLESLILSRNKIRQAAITQDIMEIIASAEALKG